jgi:repressor LexA
MSLEMERKLHLQASFFGFLDWIERGNSRAGAVGMRESQSDFQGRGKGWKTCFWFSRLSTDRHFHSLCAFVVWSNRDCEAEWCPGRVLAIVSWAVEYNRAAVTKKPFTAKQGQYLAFIFYYTKIHGFAPAESDMQSYFKVSPPSVHQMVLALEANGFIDRVPGRGRSIRLLIPREELPDLA